MDEENVYYCTKCFSLDIRTDSKKCMYCHSCGADVYKIDITSFDRWQELYTEKYGKPLIQRESVYDDLEEAYQSEATETITTEEALTNGMLVGDYINRNLHEK